LIEKGKTGSHTPVQELVEELHREMRKLSKLFMFPDDNFISDFESNALEISEKRDKEIRTQMDRTEQQINEVSAALANDTQPEPLNQDSMKSMMDVIFEYYYIQRAVWLRSKSKGSRDYTTGLIRIQTAFNSLSRAIDKYNETAISKNWPVIQSLDELQSITKQQIESSYAELMKELGAET